jgi:hypothetical protein
MWIILRGGPPELNGQRRKIDEDRFTRPYIEDNNIFHIVDESSEGLPVFQFDKKATEERRRKLEAHMKKGRIA